MPLNLNRLQYFIDCGRIDISEPINMNTLWATGAVSRVGDGVCLLGTVSIHWPAKNTYYGDHIFGMQHSTILV